MRLSIHPAAPLLRRLLFCCMILLAWPGGASAACVVRQRSVVPLQDLRNHLLVPVTVNGHSALFVLDTGAERSLVTPQAVQRLGLRLSKWVGTTMRGIGGVVEHPNAEPQSLSLGGVPLQRRTVTHDTSLTVGPMQVTTIDGQQIDGLLGRDFLSSFDLLLDPAARTLTLYQVQGCHGPFLPWIHPYMAIAARQPMDTALELPVTVDGVVLRALLDTGASASVVTLPGMVRLGLSGQHLMHDQHMRGHGIGPNAPRMWLHQFARMQVGVQVEQHPLLWVARVRVVPIVDMLLGADWLAKRRVWISFATSQVFVAMPH